MFDKGSPIKLASLLPILVLNSKGSSWKAHYVAEKILFWGWDSDTWKLLKVPWNLIARPKSKDGVDMGLILSKNKALSFKWIWHLSGSKSSGWKNFIFKDTSHYFKMVYLTSLVAYHITWKAFASRLMVWISNLLQLKSIKLCRWRWKFCYVLE